MRWPDRNEIARHPEAVAIALLLVTVSIWGATPQVTSIASSYTRPLTLTTLRVVPTALVLLLALPLLRFRLPRGRRAWLYTAAGGVLMVGVFLGCFTEAVIKAGPGNAIVLASTSPFWVAILSRWLYGERLSLRATAGLVIGFGGVVVVFSSQLGAQGSAGRTVAGLALALSASLGWALGTLIVKRQLTHQPDTDLMGVVAGQYMVGGVILVALSMAVEGTAGTRWSAPSLWLSVAFISVVGSALATIAYFGALRVVSATRATTWSFLSPVVAILIGAGLGTIPSALALFGMAVTIAGVFIVNLPARAAPAMALRPLEASVEPEIVSSASSAAP